MTDLLRSLPARFSKFVRADDPCGCWVWTGSSNQSGYGRYKMPGGLVAAHRFSYEQINGAIPEGMNILHRCDNPPCVNPDHLFAGSQADNVADMIAKGRRVIRPSLGQKNGNAKLTPVEVMAIKNDSRSSRVTARDYGISPSTVKTIRNGRTWGHL